VVGGEVGALVGEELEGEVVEEVEGVGDAAQSSGGGVGKGAGGAGVGIEAEEEDAGRGNAVEGEACRRYEGVVMGEGPAAAEGDLEGDEGEDGGDEEPEGSLRLSCGG